MIQSQIVGYKNQISLQIQGPRAVTFVINNVCYLGTGYAANGSLNDFWRYDSVNDDWVQIADVGTLPRQFSVGFVINNKGFIGTGGNAGAPYYCDFWEYCPDSNLEVKAVHKIQASIFPNPFSEQAILQSDKIFANAILTVYNLAGKQVKIMKNISGQTITLHRENLPTGLYFLRLTQDNEPLAIEKFGIIDK